MFFTFSGYPKFFVMPGLVPGIHVSLSLRQGVDGRVKPGHDDKVCGRGSKTITTPARPW
jgi:hypothetical protein